MNNILKRLWANIAPIVGMILFVILFVIGLFVFSYLLIIAAIIGLIVFIIAYVRAKLIMRRHKTPPNTRAGGRIIEHNEVKSTKKDDK